MRGFGLLLVNFGVCRVLVGRLYGHKGSCRASLVKASVQGLGSAFRAGVG